MTDPATSSSSAEQTADILAHAAAEVATEGADTSNAYECPFCVMMRKGGCEDPFQAFMACGEKADKGEIDMADCLKEFEALNKCMERNQEMFNGLLSEMKEEEDRAKQHTQAGASSSSSSPDTAAAAAAGAAAAAAGGATAMHQAAEQQPQQQAGQSAPGGSAGQPSPSSGSGSGQVGGVPATA